MEMNENDTLHIMIGRIDANVQALVRNSAAHDARITTVERRQWVTSGGIAVAVAILMPKVRAFLGPVFGV